MDAKAAARRMVDSKPHKNATDLERELYWLAQVMETRFQIHFGNEETPDSIWKIEPPKLTKDNSLYANFVHYYQLSFPERIALMLALAPFVRPQLLDAFFRKNKNIDRGFTEFGGLKGNTHGGFLPTGETVMFILAGNNLNQRFELQKMFDRDHIFARHNILKLEPVSDGEPFLSEALKLQREVIDSITTGEIHKPDFSTNFPAKLLTTKLEWSDLVLEKNVLRQIDEMKVWLEHQKTLMVDWGLGKKLRPGYRALFYGPPGTGKTMTASLLGKVTSRDVYRIDLSTVISKYIGETEKNLSKIFDQAENKGWILFFDEADALFGKRTKVEDAHDKYANQEVSYLLQRIEDFDGIIILASNMKSNLDDAFVRRFETIVNFTMPKKEERLRLWKEGFSTKSKIDRSLDLEAIAENYEMSGGAIINVIRYCSLLAISRGENVIRHEDVIDGIRKEFRKEGKTV